ncbi:NADH-quinone oxidoreductase subunit NuoE family protein [Mesoterricola sediminis]|uniref:NADH-quinone oxidoreductase subunit E n=1 Tax=Mesoterricola sediminis TaxID=2927980 RepID=A0AA48KDY6_9BACT|nr:NAD(P)H-dependent oxidoreductase subunit E [Mesoterricola sediminis]BDU76807.1 NADH-quinone oxidoreductase subunit E [Mesoterricola sediminis]
MLMTERHRLGQEVDALADRLGRDRTSLIPILLEVKRKYHTLDAFALQVIADHLGIHPVEVNSVASFYAFLGSGRQGRFVIRLCRTISCDMQGKRRVSRQLENDLGITFGQTTADGKFTLEWANCMGMCDQGPALLVNDQVYTRVTPEKVHEILEACRRVFGVHAKESKEVVIR